MTATFTWSYTGYLAEDAGKQFIKKVQYTVDGTEGGFKARNKGVVYLDRPSDSDMESRTDFATDEKIIAAVKAKLGSTKIAEIEAEQQDRLDDCLTPNTWHYKA